MRATLAAVILALVACAPRPYSADAPDRPYQWRPVAPPLAPAVVPVSLFEVTYAEGTDLHRTVVDPATLTTVADVSLGKGLGLTLIAGTESVIVDSEASVFVVNAQGERRAFSPAVAPPPIGGISAGGTIYIAAPDAIAIADADGSVVGALEAPRAAPGLPVLAAGHTGGSDPGRSWVQRLLFDDAGTFVVVETPGNSAVVDLDSGVRADLRGLRVLDATSLDGRAYLLGTDTTVIDPPDVLVEIDLTTLDVIRSSRFRSSAAAPITQRVLVTHAGDVYAYMTAPLGASRVRGELIAFDASLEARSSTIGTDVGVDATVGADDALYLFGGAARNVVTRLDPLTLDATTYAVAPADAVVRTFVAR